MEELTSLGLIRVSPDFRIIALGLPVPEFPGYPLDPPLRSRFQGRAIRPAPAATAAMLGESSRGQGTAALSRLLLALQSIQLSGDVESANVLRGGKVLPVPDSALSDAAAFIQRYPEEDPASVFRLVYPYALFGLDDVQLKALQDLQKSCGIDSKGPSSEDYHSAVSPLGWQSAAGSSSSPTRPIGDQSRVLASMNRIHELGHDICVVGEKGEGKTLLANAFASVAGYSNVELLCCYKDMTARDLILRRRYALINCLCDIHSFIHSNRL